MVLAQFTESSQECTRSLLIDAKKLLPGFDLSKNKQLLRTSWCNPYVSLFCGFQSLKFNFLGEVASDWWRTRNCGCMEAVTKIIFF